MHTQTSKSAPQAGVTLIELLITLTIFGTLVAIAIPSFESLIATTRLSSATNEMMAALAQTKSEAIRRGQRVVICVSTDGATCTGGRWDQGWIIFPDGDPATGNLPNWIIDNGEPVILASRGQAGNIRIQAQALIGQAIGFTSTGQTRNAAGNASSGIIEACTTSNSVSDQRRARDISLLVGGGVALVPPGTQNAPIVANNCPSP